MRLRGRHLLLIDLCSVAAAAVAAFVVRYEALWQIGPYIRHNAFFFAAVILIRPVIYYLFGLYHYWWRYASVTEFLSIVQAVTIGSLIVAALVFGFLAPETRGVRNFSRSILILEWMLNLLAIAGTRFLLRLLQTRTATSETQAHNKAPLRKALIMGAGDAGVLVVREMQNNPTLGYLPVGFLDDDPAKLGVQIHGVPVLGTRDDIPRLTRQEGIDEVVIAMPTAPGSAIRAVRTLCEQCKVAAKTIPGIYELLNGSVHIGQIRAVRIEDLLRRKLVHTDLAAVSQYIADAVVLVTGAGGSIGSELCRQIVARKPKRLLLLGHGETSIYNIWTELHSLAPGIPLEPLIVDVRDAERTERLLLKHRPQVIFHAAAHKHVPLMETNPEEAFTTNVLGTRNLLRAAEKAGTSRFVLISTDKAVNPVSMMGASKYLAELLVQHAARRTGRQFVVVRFGNVLGSRGSVVPFFEKQIEAGGPVTVTHPDMTRFFMTIPEAVQLVLQAAALGQGGEVFVLDMGEQVRIQDLAYDLISLSGLKPMEDIQIVFTGIRPGEKLYEELFGLGEVPVQTAHEKITLIRAEIPMDEDQLWRGINRILDAARGGDENTLVAALRRTVPSFGLATEVPSPSPVSDPRPSAAPLPAAGRTLPIPTQLTGS